MLSLSSIFSSESRRWRLRLSPAVALAVGLLLAVEIFVARSGWVWTANPRCDTALFEQLETVVLAHVKRPVVALMGSSRMVDAVPPRLLAADLGLPEGAVVNLALPTGTPFDWLSLYRRNRAVLSRARVLVLGVEDWNLNQALPAFRVTQRDRRYASLGERWRDYPAQDRLGLVVGKLWRTLDAAGQAEPLLKAMKRRRKPPIGPDGRIRWRKCERETGPAEMNCAKEAAQYCGSYRLNRGRLGQLRRLIAMAEADGVRVLLVRLPLRDSYVEAIALRHGKAERVFREAVAKLPASRVVVYDKASKLGIPGFHFYDYGHPTTLGARTVTRELARLIRETGWLAKRDAR